ncbi:hypothetical protein A2U01_0091123, partial [Trifolium medium]|nr:hypothetical protein [Trifolium medium]
MASFFRISMCSSTDPEGAGFMPQCCWR